MLKQITKNFILTFIITLLFGLILIFQTQEFLLTINYVIVTIFAIVGVIQIISYVFSKEYKSNSYYGLIIGVTCIWIALAFYQYYEVIIVFLPIVLSLYAFIIAALSIIKFIQNKNVGYLVISIISFILGIMFMFTPFFTIDVYFKVSGIYIVITSILYMLEFRKIGKENKNG